MYLTTDGPISFFDDGAAWQPITIQAQLVSTPPVAGFTAIDATPGAVASWTDSKGGILGTVTGLSPSVNDLHLLVKAAPATPYSQIVHFFPRIQNGNFSGCGVVWRESSTGNIQTFNINFSTPTNDLNLLARNWTEAAGPVYTLSSDALPVNRDYSFIHSGNGIWLRLADDGVNRTYAYSTDGTNFLTLVSTIRTSFITPDEIGLMIGNMSNTGEVGLNSAAAFYDSFFLG